MLVEDPLKSANTGWTGREMATSQDFVNWVCGPELDPIFLMGALMQAREHLRSLASGSTHKTIYFPTVKQFATIVPPLALQKEFSARVTDIRDMQVKQGIGRQRLDDCLNLSSMVPSAGSFECVAHQNALSPAK
jgi:hypothetical protein